jgi:hypothetical protein
VIVFGGTSLLELHFATSAQVSFSETSVLGMLLFSGAPVLLGFVLGTHRKMMRRLFLVWYVCIYAAMPFCDKLHGKLHRQWFIERALKPMINY